MAMRKVVVYYALGLNQLQEILPGHNQDNLYLNPMFFLCETMSEHLDQPYLKICHQQEYRQDRPPIALSPSQLPSQVFAPREYLQISFQEKHILALTSYTHSPSLAPFLPHIQNNHSFPVYDHPLFYFVRYSQFGSLIVPISPLCYQ